jgi:NAD-dependent deacetylase
VTQNIDRLHRKAGTERLIEVHGSIDTSSCTSCDASYGLDGVEELFTNGVAHCTSCEGLVKPDVVLFGKFLPEDAMREAHELAERCDLMLCVGSSLEVYPVAGLPGIALAAGAKLAIVTQGDTPYDEDAAVKLDGDVVEEMAAVMAALG